ncbi:ferredoxin [Rhodococcoides trifolii]|uniref:Ferredoxin n=1 Tax=Rhodococcoides trifolii TaxID=908250 RepID=A0A917LHM5_9NOCA|nr:ferredoxin [Rhodococcus trifolii]GGG24130.1 ferredoxin [Rhodococcus trifolii]
MTWKIEISDACIGSGMCAAIEPDEFELESGYARATSGSVEPRESYLDAADSCPVSAITVIDAQTGAELGPR